MEILKLGGSVVTHKDSLRTPNAEAINRLATEVATAGPRKLIIVHGGGSYGHPLAKEYEISTGYKSPRQLAGFSLTHQAMVELNMLIVTAFLEVGVPTISISPSSFIITEDQRMTTVDFSVVSQAVDSGFVPILYGDAVLDSVLRFTILSGDQLAARLAIDLGASKIIFGVDVDGVYTTNPKLVKEAQLIDELSFGQMRSMIKVGEALSTDVTGGMLGKIREAGAAVEAGVDVQLVNALKPGMVHDALRGEKVKCTWLRR
ncbi:MAG: isopentenyl phosphate kinase [Candidatus Bathyarchaeia archaeon]|jgi:isopentenyl phosphate kinase